MRRWTIAALAVAMALPGTLTRAEPRMEAPAAATPLVLTQYRDGPRDRLAEMRQRIAELAAALERSEEARRVQADRIRDLEALLEDRRPRRPAVRRKLRSQRGEIADLEGENEMLQGLVAQRELELTERTRERDAAQSRYEERAKRVESLVAYIQTREALIADVRQQVAERDDEIAELRARFERVRDRREDRRERRGDRIAELEALAAENEERVDRLRGALRNREKQIEALQTELAAARRDDGRRHGGRDDGRSGWNRPDDGRPRWNGGDERPRWNQ